MAIPAGASPQQGHNADTLNCDGALRLPARGVNAYVSIQVEELHKAYGPVQALQEVTLRLEAEVRYGVLGPEGAGKSTLSRILAGLEPADRGTIRVADVDGQDHRAASKVGYVPEQPGLDGQRTPRELLRFAGRFHPFTASEIERRLEELLIGARLEHVGGVAIENLARGMHPRIALAYALVHDPAILLLDDPLRGLAPSAARRMREAIEELVEDRCLVVFTSAPSVVEQLCDHVVGLEAGRIVVDRPINDVVSAHTMRYKVHIRGELSAKALDGLREHTAIGAVRHGDRPGAFELWLTEAEQAPDVLALLEDAHDVLSFARAPTSLAEAIDEHMEEPP